MKQRESLNSPSGGCDKACGMVKHGTPDVDTHPTTIDANASCFMAANSDPCLELPTPMPSSPVGARKERKIVVRS
ncbi:unnamed protein product [Dovyalis caffra]|uniref:Uncharacterized protein n=1 Tax=Dovyalis caffra TaxID=77055 RepID=A0AAV1RIZ0_9ROSI|nr:unnamed protein product [Dovyalis caffra]